MKRLERAKGIALILLLAVIGLGGVGAQESDTATAVFAGGCFWCMEKPFDELDGVIATTSGYAGGHVPNPTYEQVSAGGTGHLESVRVTYDPRVVSYEELLYVYWRNVDPLDDDGQFCDQGYSYQPAIFTQTVGEREIAVRSRDRVAELLGTEPLVDIRTLNAFYPAEEYHQDYYIKNPIRYRYYRARCGRDRRLNAVWGDEAGGHDPDPHWLNEMN